MNVVKIHRYAIVVDVKTRRVAIVVSAQKVMSSTAKPKDAKVNACQDVTFQFSLATHKQERLMVVYGPLHTPE